MAIKNRDLLELISESLSFSVDEHTLFYCVEDDSDGEGYYGFSKYYQRIVEYNDNLYIMECDENRELDEEVKETLALIDELGYCLNDKTKEDIAYHMENLCMAYDKNGKIIYDVFKITHAEWTRELAMTDAAHEESYALIQMESQV